MRQFVIKLKRDYHRWCLKNAMAYHGMRICSYNEVTNSYTACYKFSSARYHVFVNAQGKIIIAYIPGT